MPELKLCASTTISIALKPFNYNAHGHDVTIEACWCTSFERRVDLEVLAEKLEKVAEVFDRRPLWELLGLDNAMIEDLLLEISRRLSNVEGLRLCSISARWANNRGVFLSF